MATLNTHATAERSFEVGKFYTVPAVRTTGEDVRDGICWLPVLGPEHSDKEHINFPAEHWHIDWRFAPDRSYRSATGFLGPSHCYAVIIQRFSNSNGKPLVEGDPVMRRMKCKRELPAYPFHRVPWLAKLKDAYADHKLKPGMVCPHRGLPLQGCPRDGDVVTCPGHGLRWNVTTGALVT